MAQPAFDGHQYEIQQIAYEIWESEGRPTGQDAEHYYRAERVWAERRNGPVVVKSAAAKAARSPKATTRKATNGVARKTTTRARKTE